jgi:hypothetical protein
MKGREAEDDGQGSWGEPKHNHDMHATILLSFMLRA